MATKWFRRSALDFAYSVSNCLSLKQGTFARGDRLYGKPPEAVKNPKIWCPAQDDDTKEGICDPELSARNTDSIVLTAVGGWFSNQCGKTIPIENAASSTSSVPKYAHVRSDRLNRRDAACNTTPDTDSVIIDGPNPDQFDSAPAPVTSSLATTSTAMTIATSAKPIDPPCIHFGGPTGDDYCVCSNSATVPVASSTGSNTGKAYNPCPWSTLPPAALTNNPPPSLPPSPTKVYAITTALGNGEVLECESSTLGDYGGYKETFCAGSTAILKTSPPTPFASVQVGKKRQNVGTLAPSALYTSISSALDKLCPTATGDLVSCSTDTVEIKGINYVTSEALMTGVLGVSVLASSYNDTSLRDAMIKAAAQTAQTSASNSSSCYNAPYQVCARGCTTESVTLCNTAQFAGVQVYNGRQNGATNWLDAQWEFGEYSGGEFDCEVILDALNLALDIIAPEFAFADTAASDGIMAACEDVLGR